MSAIKVSPRAQEEKGAFGPPRASLESRQLHPLGKDACVKVTKMKLPGLEAIAIGFGKSENLRIENTFG